MKHHFFKAYSFLFYFLFGITSFFVGLSYAGFIDAGKGQMLAGGAIVLGYGIVGGCIGFLISLFVVFKSNRKIIIRLNIILAICIAAFYLHYHLKYKERQKTQELENEKFEQQKPKNPTEIEDNLDEIAMLLDFETLPKIQKAKVIKDSEMGLGMFTPNFYDNPVLYFYGNVTLEKSVMEQVPTDSITFKRMESGGFQIATAPPWLVPDHLKLDYGILYFKVQALTHDFLEVTVNSTTSQTAFVDRHAGKLHYWPEFLLGVHSVEFPIPEDETIYVKPLDHAGKTNVPYSFMKPVHIKNEWMYVALQDDSFKTVSKGWIKWHKNGKLLIRYSLLS